MITRAAYAEAALMDSKQAAILRSAIRANRHGLILDPQASLDSLRYKARGELDVCNRFARRLWAKRWGGHLSEALGGTAPYWTPKKTVHLVTIADRDQLFATDRGNALVRHVSARQAARRYEQLLQGLSGIGMLEGKLYVYLPAERGFYRAVNWHAHVLVWNVSCKKLEQWAHAARKKLHAFDVGATSVDVQLVDRTWPHLMGYLNKMPGGQNRVNVNGRKPSADWTNGVNAAFLYAAFEGATLDKITIAAGQGKGIRRRSVKAVRRVTGTGPRRGGHALFRSWKRAQRPRDDADDYFVF